MTPAESVLHKLIAAGAISLEPGWLWCDGHVNLTDDETALIERLMDDVLTAKAAAVTAHMSDVEIGVTWDEACEAMQAETVAAMRLATPAELQADAQEARAADHQMREEL